MGALAVAPPIHIHTYLRWRSIPDIFNSIYQILFSEITHAFLLPVSVHSIGDTDTVTARVDGHPARKCFKLLPAAVCVRVNLYQYTPTTSPPYSGFTVTVTQEVLCTNS